MLRIELPLPAKVLHPNASKPASRAGMIGLNKAKAKARSDAKWAAIAAWRTDGPLPFDEPPPRWEKATIKAVWRFPKSRVRDNDNLVGWLKAYCDGLADAGIIRNDSGLVWLAPDIDSRCVRSCVVLEVTPA